MFLYEGTSKCLVEGIHRFPASHIGYYKEGDREIKLRRYWNTLDHIQKDLPKRYEDQVEMFRELLIDACRIRMISQVPLGTAISGGLDSSSLICTMNALSKNKSNGSSSLKSFTSSFPGTPIDEHEYVDIIDNHLGIKTDHTLFDFTQNPDNIGHYLNLFEELSQAVPLPVIQLYKRMKEKGIKVSIDGHGADELLGYPSSLDYLLFDNIGYPAKSRLILKAKKDSVPDGKQFDYINSLTTIYFKSITTHHIKTGAHLLAKAGLYNKRLPLRNSPQIPGFSFFDSHLYDMFHHTIMPTLLRNYDRCSMINGVEIRMPFLDYRIVNFLFSLPWQSKCRNGITKSILRDAVKPELPAAIYNRRSKIGFGMPLIECMKNGWNTFIKDTIHSNDFNNCTLINPKAVKKSIQQVLDKPDISLTQATRAWTDFTPYLWEKYFLKNTAGSVKLALSSHKTIRKAILIGCLHVQLEEMFSLVGNLFTGC